MKLPEFIAVTPMLAALCCVVSIAPTTAVHATARQEQKAASGARTELSGSASQSAANSSQTPPAWSRDIAPIFYSNCTSCHHPGGAGPFSLLTYQDARRWGPQVLLATQSRFMPPWLPEPGFGDFADVRRLNDVDRDLIRRWVSGGMREGDVAQAPAAPRYDSAWTLGKPDLILKIERPITLVAGGTDVFRNLILPYPLKETHFIRAMEIRPSAPRVVHHANILIDRTASLRRSHPADWEDGIPGMELVMDAGNRFDPDGHFLFWKPDTPALVEPTGMPWRLDPGNDLVLNMHLKPSGKTETVDAQVGLYFATEAASRQPMLLQLDRDDALDIPAGDSHFVVEDSLTLPVDVEVLGVYPHAHYLGRDLEGWAILPGGQKKWLVWIRSWDIDRQSVYRYKKPIRLPKGAVLHMRYTYDNSTANAHNPHSPPVRVRAGNRSDDEMSHLWLQVLPANNTANGHDPRLLLEEAWMRNRLRKSPRDRVSLYNLAAALAGQGKFAEATAYYERLLSLDPEDVRALTALGAALDGAGDWRNAEERYRGAIAASTKDVAGACDARYDLARVELQHSELEKAVLDFRVQLKDCPEDAETWRGLAETEFESGQTDEAIRHFGESLRLDPNSAETHEQLARAWAGAGRQDNATAEMRIAAKLSPDDAVPHAALSQLLAAKGIVADAIVEEKTALKLVENDPDGWNNLGVLEARAGDVAAARSDFAHALRLQPDHVQARANLARLGSAN